jgi:hypothetical protein
MKTLIASLMISIFCACPVLADDDTAMAIMVTGANLMPNTFDVCKCVADYKKHPIWARIKYLGWKPPASMMQHTDENGYYVTLNDSRHN